MIYITNNTGNTAEYKVENFVDTYQQQYDVFSIWGNCSMTPGMYCAPINYNGVLNLPNFDDEITVTGFPMCSYTIDSFKAWLAQNAGMITATAAGLIGGWVSTIAGGAIAGAGLTATGAMSGGYIGQHLQLSAAEQAMANRYSQGVQMPGGGLIAGTLGALGSLFDHSRRPPQIHGNNNASLAYQAGQMTFSWYHKQIRTEYAAIIDKFFE